MFTRTSVLVLPLLLGTAMLVQAKDAYFDISVRDLKLVDGKLTEPSSGTDWRHYERTRAMQPYALLDGPGEVYLTGPGADSEFWASTVNGAGLHVHLRAPADQETKGRLVVANSGGTGMDVLRFVVPAAAAKAEAKSLFYQAKMSHYNHLLNRNLPRRALVPARDSTVTS